MPKRSTDFQRLVALINGTIRGSASVTESAMLIDSVIGEEREVDILLTSEVADRTVNVSIEVTEKGRKSGAPWVEQMYAKHLNLPTDKLVLVSKSGFYKPALMKAKSLGIDTIAFEEALERDWDLVARMTTDGFFSITSINYQCSAQLEYADGTETIRPVNKNVTVYLPYRDVPTDFEQMALYFLNQPEMKKVIDRWVSDSERSPATLEYEPQKGTCVVDGGGKKIEIRKVFFALVVDKKSIPITFSTGRYDKKDVAFGQSTEPHAKLFYVFVRGEGDDVKGLLLDESGLRSLSVTA